MCEIKSIEYVTTNIQRSLAFWNPNYFHKGLKRGCYGLKNYGHTEIKEKLFWFRHTSHLQKSWRGVIKDGL